jgi:hypothetical protein
VGYATHASNVVIAVGASLALSVINCSANDDIPSPQISSVTPNHATAGAVVTIIGNFFCQRPNNGTDDPTCAVAGTVHFGTAPGTPSAWSETALMVEVPQLTPGRADIAVTAAGRTSNTVMFTAE